MRTVTLQSVYDAILRRHGLDPVGDAVKADTARAITEHINERVQSAWKTWPFPEVTHTEERAYRTVWNDTRQFHRANGNGNPDELFFIPSAGYYKVNAAGPSDPPVGLPPATQDPVTHNWATNTTYYADLSPVDTYVEYDQPCKRPIEQVLGIYSQNPRVKTADPYGRGICLLYRPSEMGIDVINAPGPTVFVHYMIPPPTFTMRPYIDGKSYRRSDRAFYPPAGNCYRSLVDNNTTLPSDATHWTLEPFPAVLARYVRAGAYADCLRDTFQGEDQIRLARAAAAIAEAQNYLNSEIEKLAAQRQIYSYYRSYFYPSGICVTQPWTGFTVTDLTDKCEEDWTFPPTPSQPAGAQMDYAPTIASLIGPQQPALNTIPTTNLPLLTGKDIAIVIGGSLQQQTWQLLQGSADPTDPGHVQPLDHDDARNNVFWYRIG